MRGLCDLILLEYIGHPSQVVVVIAPLKIALVMRAGKAWRAT